MVTATLDGHRLLSLYRRSIITSHPCVNTLGDWGWNPQKYVLRRYSHNVTIHLKSKTVSILDERPMAS